MILQIDSAAIQEVVQIVTTTGTSFLPGAYKLLAPAISALVTLITAAIIRAIEKGGMKKKQRIERQELIQAYLSKDSAALAEKISELQNRKK